MSELENPILRLTVKAAAATAENIFLETDGTLPAADGNALGPTYMQAAAGEHVAVTVLGVALATAGAAVVAGAAVKVTATGKVITATNNTVTVGRALEAAAADGDSIRILLITN